VFDTVACKTNRKELRMLTFKDLKQLRSERRHPANGTKLIVTVDLPNWGLQAGEQIEFLSFNVFISASGESKISHEMGFGVAGGAHSWDDFSTRARRWIQENYAPERCEFNIIQRVNDVIGIKASRVRLA
jgi:hypothetical protein